MDGRWIVGLALVGALAGCGGKPPPAYPDYAPTTAPPPVAADNGFALYLQAANDAEARGDRLKTRVSFTVADKKTLYDATEPAIRLLDKATSQNVEFVFAPHKPLEAPPHQIGWFLIGKSLNWHISDDCHAGQYDAAIGYVVLSTKFGFDLTGGGATDASLGLTIVDDARKAILDAIPQMTVEQLQKLSDGIVAALKRKPELSKALENEHANMLAAIQFIQDAYRKNDYDTLIAKLGPDVRDAVKYLQQQVRPHDEIERPKYFDGFAKEADAETRWVIQMASEPAVRRAASKGPDLVADRPWKRWAKNFFESGRSLLRIEDATLARTRLLALSALIEARRKKDRQAPSSLSDFPPELLLDPFTGGTFGYRAQGIEFKLYSAGDNFRDDGGHTDGSYSHPDLRLEVAQ